MVKQKNQKTPKMEKRRMSLPKADDERVQQEKQAIQAKPRRFQRKSGANGLRKVGFIIPWPCDIMPVKPRNAACPQTVPEGGEDRGWHPAAAHLFIQPLEGTAAAHGMHRP